MKPKVWKDKVKTETGEELEVCLMRDGMPLYVYDDNREERFDAPAAVGKIKTSMNDLDAAKTALGQAEAKLAAYTDHAGNPIAPDAVRTATQQVADMDGKSLVDAKGMKTMREEVAAQIEGGWKTKLADQEAAAKRAAEAAAATIRKLTVGQQFVSSPFFAGGVSPDGKKIEPKVVGSPAAWEDMIGKHYDADASGVVTAYWDPDTKKQVIYSRVDPSKPAGFQEAAEMIIGARPDRESLMRGVPSQGTGTPSGTTATTTTTATRETTGAILPSASDLISEGLAAGL